MKLLSIIAVLILTPCFLLAQTRLDWAKHFGGTDGDAISSMKLDTDHNVYITGTFSGTVDFDMGTGTHSLTSKGSIDIFLAKYDSSGNFIWVSQIGGKSDELTSMLLLDDSNNVYVTGIFTDTVDFDPSASTFDLQSSSDNSFVAKYNHNGNLIWAKPLGNTHWVNLSLDSNYNITLTGYFHGTVDIDPGIAVCNLNSSGDDDSFILRLNSTGDFLWVKQIGGNINSVTWALSSIYSSGYIYISGYMNDTIDFDPSLNIYNLFPQNGHTFLLKLDSAGNFIWAKNYGRNIGPGTAYGSNLTIDSKNNIYLQGYFSGTIDMDPGLINELLVSKGKFDVFIAKLDNYGNLIWAKSMGGIEDDFPGMTAIDSLGNVFLTGNFCDTIDIDPGTGIYNLVCHATFAGTTISYISKLDSSGNFQWASQIGEKYKTAAGIELDNHENIYIYGSFYSTCDVDLSVGVHDLTSFGKGDCFISKSNRWPVGIKEEEELTMIILHPNPTSGLSNLELNASQTGTYIIDIFSMDGKLLQQLNGVFYSGKNNIEINLTHQTNGIFVASVYIDNQKIKTFKIIKK